MTAMVNASHTQSAFAEVQNDAADESATLNTTNANFTSDPDTVFRIRFAVQQTVPTANQQLDITPTLFYSYNSGSFTQVDNNGGTTQAVHVISIANITDNASTSQRISSDSFVAGHLEDTAAAATTTAFTSAPGATEVTEYEWALEIEGTFSGLANNDTIDIRVHDGTAAIENYTNTPRVTVTGIAGPPITAWTPTEYMVRR